MNESSDRNKSRSGKSAQASGRGKSSARGAATDKSAQRRGGQHSHGGR